MLGNACMAAIDPKTVRSALVARFRAEGDPTRAKSQQAYMKTTSLERKEFWLRKAIGWALRQQAEFHEAQVLAFVKEHQDVLSGLTKREALKHSPEKIRLALG